MLAARTFRHMKNDVPIRTERKGNRGTIKKINTVSDGENFQSVNTH